MSRVAFFTFALLRELPGDPRVQGFFDRLDQVWATVDASAGLIDRYRDDPVDSPFGAYATGRFVTPDRTDREAQTLSLWADLEAVFAFAYASAHAEALRGRTAWFLKPAWPTYVAWWVADDHWPDWPEANTRLEYLHDHGASSLAFDFRSPFDANGRPTSLDRGRVAELRRQ